MNININDKFVTVKKAWFIDEGTIINVTDVDEDNIVSFTFGEDNANNGYMDINTFNKHFEKIEDIAANVATTTITEEHIESIMENSEFEVFTSFNKCTIVSCRLPNGFVVTESSACVNPEDYNEDLGADICINKIMDKVWELEAYRLQQELWTNNKCDDCPYEEGCGCDDFDECLDTDLDCDDCQDVDCPYRAN